MKTLSFDYAGFAFHVEEGAPDTGFTYRGFCDGRLSISASRVDIAARALVR